ncbi:hypothetical protein BS47DRAFT_1376523 [Hydnum rufescens UP504]|uniref:tRNA (guanine(26)-N(2))-dimethyltransferase n=1 Tax=Hydnum rufescens UP504 TaxID=1448309 RepID=A0A9P6AZE3_9AGAM|nr:hypothetical protein BS47DRAFT_1376523 [Hydnum rufescens UP504]
MSSHSPIVVPEGFTLHKENSAYILLPSDNGAFLNTVQEFNRDLSIACIRAWSERNNRDKQAKFLQRQTQLDAKNATRKTKKRKTDGVLVHMDDESTGAQESVGVDPASLDKVKGPDTEYRTHKITILEPLSATGLRSIRYANEIPLVKHVIANDISLDAIAAMQRNVDINGLAPPGHSQSASEQPNPIKDPGDSAGPSAEPRKPTVTVNEGDATALMYSQRTAKTNVDVVDLDPYGTAAPFIDGAVQCVVDNGLLCITCTDLAVLAGNNYPEKCFANYGGMPLKAEYCHEAALRLVLHSVATAAARYGRSITPLLSLSIDFYVRIFVQVRAAPIEVKKLACNTAVYYVCTSCQAWHEQPLGKAIEKANESSGNVNRVYKTTVGPPTAQECEECASKYHVAGPMWSGPLHDREFVKEVLDLVNANPTSFGTTPRMQGMLTVASEELDVPFYFTPAKVAGFFQCNCPSLQDISSALLNAGHSVSRSHAAAGSIKTTASQRDIHDVFRSWIKLHPVKMSNIKEELQADFTRHPKTLTSSVKLVRYQQNPTPHWGPGTRAGGSKRKRSKEGKEESQE